MDDNSLNLPKYLKFAQITLGLAAFFFILYIGQEIIKPLIFATIIAILLNPVVNFLFNHRINRVLSIALALLSATIVLIGLSYFIGSQLVRFEDSLPEFRQKLEALINNTGIWITEHFSVSKSTIDDLTTQIKDNTWNNSSQMLGKTLGTVSSLFVSVILMPVYVFMILFYKPLLLEFISQLFEKKEHKVVAEVLVESKALIQSYLVGLLLEAVLVAILNSAGLLLLGVQYAILLGILGALLNIIPYIGGIIAIGLAMIVALASQPPVVALYVLLVYLAVQFVDNNYFVPRIVASKVKLNALVSIIVVLIGAALWGIPGMFLSIPITAILKVIFDRVEGLKPFGFLLGDNQPPITKVIFHFYKPSQKKRIPEKKQAG